jgi:hypothetical protein
MFFIKYYTVHSVTKDRMIEACSKDRRDGNRKGTFETWTLKEGYN